MSTNIVYCFEHAASGTILRANHIRGLEIFRDHEMVATVPFHMNEQVGASVEGIVNFSSEGKSWILDLAGSFPQQRRQVPSGVKIHPDGLRIFHCSKPRFPLVDPDGISHKGICQIDLSTGRVVETWTPDTENPKRVTPFGAEADEKLADYLRQPTAKGTIFDRFTFEFVVAEDGQTWAMADHNRLELGRGRKHLASVCWEPYWHFYPANCTLKPNEERAYMASKYGLVAFGLDGTVEAFFKSQEEICSPVVAFNGELVAVVSLPQGIDDRAPIWYRLQRFCPSTLKNLGDLTGFGPFRSSDKDFGLLVLADGSLVVCPRQEALRLLPPIGAKRKTSEYVMVVGDEPPPKIPHPTSLSGYDIEVGTMGRIDEISSATEGQRQALARFFLEDGCADPRFRSLLLYDPEAFVPWRELVAEWSDSDLAGLVNLDRSYWWLVTQGASDKTAAKLSARLRKELGRCNGKLSDLGVALCLLLAGTGTKKALTELGELGRCHEQVRVICTAHHVDVPSVGPAQIRYAQNSVDIVRRSVPRGQEAVNAAELELGLTLDEWMPSGLGTLSHVVTLPLSLLPGNPLVSSTASVFHFFLAPNNDCGVLSCHLVDGSDRLVELVGRLEESNCSGGLRRQLARREGRVKWALALTKHEPDGYDQIVGRLGSVAHWWQQPEVPFCSNCKRLMFYVGYVETSGINREFPDTALFGFHCERCGESAQVMQIT